MKRKKLHRKNKAHLQSIDIQEIEQLTAKLANSYPKSLKEANALENLLYVIEDIVSAYETDKDAEKPKF